MERVTPSFSRDLWVDGPEKTRRWPERVMTADRSRSLAVSKRWYCMSHSSPAAHGKTCGMEATGQQSGASGRIYLA